MHFLKASIYSYSLAFLISSKIAFAAQLNVGSFNINSNRATVNTIVQQIIEHKNIDVWGLSESSDEWSGKAYGMLHANHKNISIIKGTSGFSKNRLQIIYDEDKLELLSTEELHDINVNNLVRSPLVAKFKDIKTQQIFLFMVNHLYRKNDAERIIQARKINQWARDQTLPVIAVGDYNFDMSPLDITKRGQGFDEITKNQVFTWVQPSELLPTQCSSYKSILDFVFISNKLNYTNIKSSISYGHLSYCDRKNNFSDHRPVTASIDWV